VTLKLLVVVVKMENNSKFQRKFAELKKKQRNFVFGGGRIINYAHC
jgi:hypothetical protein